MIATLAEIADSKPEVAALLMEFCDHELPEFNRQVVSRVMDWLGTPDGRTASLNPIDDSEPVPIPQGIWDQLRAAFVERRPCFVVFIRVWT